MRADDVMRRRMTTNNNEDKTDHEAEGAANPRPVAVSVITTEHFTLQGARSSTIAESTGRASMFLSAISGGLVALGLIATATHTGTAFFVFGLILLPTLAFVGLVTFDRVLQSGIEDLGYARRIAALRGYYFDVAPELAPFLMSVPESKRLNMQGLRAGLWQGCLTVAGMVSVVASVLAGAAVGLVAAVLSGHSLVAAVCAGAVAGIATLAALTWYQHLSWDRALAAPLIISERDGSTGSARGAAVIDSGD
jgi:hypothetical protein